MLWLCMYMYASIHKFRVHCWLSMHVCWAWASEPVCFRHAYTRTNDTLNAYALWLCMYIILHVAGVVASADFARNFAAKHVLLRGQAAQTLSMIQAYIYFIRQNRKFTWHMCRRLHTHVPLEPWVENIHGLCMYQHICVEGCMYVSPQNRKFTIFLEWAHIRWRLQTCVLPE
jgi:hypothetical protein